MNASEHSERLRQFFSTFFHEDWELEAPTADRVVEDYVAATPDPEALRKLADEIAELAAAHRDQDSLDRVLFDELGCYYDPGMDGISTQEWLASVVARLRGAPSLA